MLMVKAGQVILESTSGGMELGGQRDFLGAKVEGFGTAGREGGGGRLGLEGRCVEPHHQGRCSGEEGESLHA